MFAKALLTSAVLASFIINAGCGSDSSTFSILPDSESFQQSTDSVNTKIDILWVVDNSNSMRTSQEDLANNFGSFIANFQAKGYDFKMAVTTSDAYLADTKYLSFYNYNGVYGNYKQKYFDDLAQADKALFRDGVLGDRTGFPVFSHLTPSISQVFQKNILQGINGWGYERPFESILETLAHPGNQNFIRDDSFFAIIIVTDEDDFSTDTNQWLASNTHPDLTTVSSYVTELDRITNSTGATRRYNVSNISILDETCREALNDVFTERIVASRVQQLTDATEGFQGSLCGNFGSELSLIADKIITLSNQFYLDRLPIPETIRVVVNGNVIPKVDPLASGAIGWYYNSEANSVVFTPGAVPEQGASISINFDPASLDLD